MTDGKIQRLRKALREAEAILIGGGAGLSASAGLTYGGTRFQENFAPFIEKYGMKDMYTAGFYPFPSERAKWAYWAKHILVNRYDPPALPVYLRLYQLARDRDYFVLTTNVDGQFVKAGFSQERLFATQGDYGLFQCASSCHDTLYDNFAAVTAMAAQTQDCLVPQSLVPRCPVCGGKMAVHLRIDSSFVENQDWHDAQSRFVQFLHHTADKRLLLLELGVGMNTPGIIRFPFEQLTARQPKVTLARINRDMPLGWRENQSRALSFGEDIGKVLMAL